MMKAIQAVSTMMLCLVFFAASAGAADVAKIGVVDFQKVLKESEAGKDAQNRIQKKHSEMQNELQGLAGEIEKLQKQVERDSMVMSKDKREEKKREITIKKMDLRSKKEEYQSQLQEIQSRIVGQLREEIFSIAEKIGREEGYLMIIEKSAVIYSPGSIDITDRLINKYNGEFGGSQQETQ